MNELPVAKTYSHHQEILQRSDIDAISTATADDWHVVGRLFPLRLSYLAWIMNQSARTMRNDGTFVKQVDRMTELKLVSNYSPTKRTGTHAIGPG
jgi:hypothetical protein